MFTSKELEKECKPLVTLDVIECPDAFYRADTIDSSRSFARNYGGYVRSDIAVINEQNNLEVAMSLIDSLVQRPSDGKIDIEDNDLRLSLRSKYCQSPSEQCTWLENQLELADRKELERIEQEEKSASESKKQKDREIFAQSLTQEERDKIRVWRREKELRDYVEG